jgi:signal peptidase I
MAKKRATRKTGSKSTDTSRSRRQSKKTVPLSSKVYAFAKEVVITLAIVLVIQTFAFGSFHVPTPSMENNILVGDRLIASKMHYGGRTPQTFGIPFTNIFLPGFELASYRVPGFTDIKRDDIVVFNFPPEDVPIERKTHYVKRTIGLPGDTIELRDKVLYVNGTEIPVPEGAKEHYMATLSSTQVTLPMSRLRALGVGTVQPVDDGIRYLVPEISASIAAEIESWPYVETMERFVIPDGSSGGMEIFPEGSGYNPHQYGPLRIPSAGDKVTLDDNTWPIYRDVITRYEGHVARRTPEGRFEIDGVQTDEYVVEQDYYFMMGDNRDNSLDSRAWGFVPADHVAAKVLFTYFSWDAERTLPRLGRIGTIIR